MPAERDWRGPPRTSPPPSLDENENPPAHGRDVRVETLSTAFYVRKLQIRAAGPVAGSGTFSGDDELVFAHGSLQ